MADEGMWFGRPLPTTPEGNFIDDYKATEKICRDAVKGGSMQELKNCDEFLEFIKNVGYK